jgi:KaiC/GvpD/RAD55 family RecA-like ATPase/transcriptional regulator with XRE-family HTH domain
MNAKPAQSFATTLQQALTAKGWSKKRLALFLEKDASTVSLWLAGRHRPRPDEEQTIAKLATFLDQDPAAVRTLIITSPDCSPEERHERPGRIMILTTLEDCERILPSLLEPLLSKQLALSIAGMQAKMYEQGYSIREDLLRAFLPYYLDRKGYSWNREQQVFVPPGGEHVAPPHLTYTWQHAMVRQACALLNRAFAATTDESLPHAEVLQLIREVLTTSVSLPQPSFDASTILNALLKLKLLARTDQDRVQRRWLLNPEFLINHHWGIQTHIQGLDDLLDGGLLLPATGGLSILIEGRPGTGKTSFALQLAASVAAGEGCAVYLSAEENLWRLVERLSFAGYAYRQVPSEASPGILVRAGQEFALLLCDFIDTVHTSTWVKKHREEGRGTLILVAMPNRDISSEPRKNPLLHDLRLFLEESAQRGLRTCYALDSLDALLHTGGRRLYESLFALADQSIGLFLSEERYETQQMDERLQRAHVVDMVIRLSEQVVDAPGGPLQRFIEIRKSRTQHHRRGQHQLGFHSGQGITIYPSIQALLSVWMQRIRRATDPEPEDWIVKKGTAKELNFNNLLQHDVVRGSTILLTGPPASHKLAIALTFLASQLEADQDSQVLLISLHDDEPTLLKIIRTYPQLASLLGDEGRFLHPRLRVLYCPPDYFTAARFVDWIRRTLATMKPRGIARRVVFHSLNQLRHSSPLFLTEPLFVAALLEIFRKEQLTALFVQVQREDPQSQDVFDTILTTEHGPLHDPDTVQFRVGHTPSCDAYRATRWIRRVRDPNLKGTAWLELLAALPSHDSSNLTTKTRKRSGISLQ